MTTRTELLECNRDYIIAEYTGRHGKRRSASSIAREFGVSLRTVGYSVAKWREAGLLEYMGNRRIDQERDTIEELHRFGLIPEEIGEKLGYSRSTVTGALQRWGLDPVVGRECGDELPSINLDQLKKGAWVDITERTLLTVGRVPRFYLIPIGGEAQ